MKTGSALRVGCVAIALRVGCIATASLWLAAAPAAAVPGDPFDLRAVCRDDFRRLCSELGGEAARGEILRCLEAHEDELSPACRIAVGEERGGDEDPEAPRRDPR